MQEGIGRGGYRMLALVFLGIGLLGLASSLYAFVEPTTSTFFNALGFVLTGFAMSALFVLALIVLGRPARAPPVAEAPEFAGAPAPTAAQPARPIQFEFTEQDEPEAEPEPEPAAPSPSRPRAPSSDFARAARVVGLPESPMARLPEPDRWAPPDQPRAPVVAPPKKRPGSGITLGEKREMERQGRLNAQIMARQETQHELALPIPQSRAPPARAGVPTLVAKAATGIQDGDWIPEGNTRGVCSKCKTVILAPEQRPINLRCPRCDKVTYLA